ncbi:Uncharacterised protein [Streptococcus pneumoniae]|nr:hypothetical protein HMPREF0837_11822 [Streptococcus pneumoniae TCH8431/19A]CAG5147125.1 Uncharacterised protein [Streptococcus pneumoniae]
MLTFIFLLFEFHSSTRKKLLHNSATEKTEKDKNAFQTKN